MTAWCSKCKLKCADTRVGPRGEEDRTIIEVDICRNCGWISPERNPDANDLTVILIDRLVAWVARTAPRVRDETCDASIKFTLLEPQGDEDETLCLTARVEEHISVDEESGRISGVKWR